MDPRRLPSTPLLRGMTQRRLTPQRALVQQSLAQRRLSRRGLFQAGGISAAALALAACTTKPASTPVTGPVTAEQFWAGKAQHGSLRFANWPLYMDTDNKPELTAFTRETGIQVTYDEVIDDMPSWSEKVWPVLEAGQSIGYDLMVITDGINFGQFVQRGLLAPLDHSRLTNFAANVDPVYTRESFDPGNVYSIPWAIGMTGLAYDPAVIGGDINSWQELFANRDLAGTVSMPTDTQELANIGLFVNGVEPTSSTPKDWEAAAAFITARRADGFIKKFYDQSYIDALAAGEVAVSWAWSGDILQQNIENGTNFKFVIPSDGASIWIDNMTIPITAENPVDALQLMDFFYRVDIQASLMEYLGYVTPVPGVQAVMQQDADQAATDDDRTYLQDLLASPTVFPTADTYTKLHYYVEPATHALEQEYLSIFEPLIS